LEITNVEVVPVVQIIIIQIRLDVLLIIVKNVIYIKLPIMTRRKLLIAREINWLGIYIDLS